MSCIIYVIRMMRPVSKISSLRFISMDETLTHKKVDQQFNKTYASLTFSATLTHSDNIFSDIMFKALFRGSQFSA